MSRFPQFHPGKIRDYPLDSRPGKVEVQAFSRPFEKNSLEEFFDSLPDILAVKNLRMLAAKIIRARSLQKPIIWGFGGHVIKVGLAPVLIDLMQRGLITTLATNGSGIIHDFEIAFSGRTSEDVESRLESGEYGMARETGTLLNQAIERGAAEGKGIGEAVGELLESSACRFPAYSLLLQAHRGRCPVTVHLAIGTDTIINHPRVSGSALGEGSLIDFRILTHQVSRLDGGGVYLNVGSAVILPEVFLKAVSLVRNSGVRLQDFSTANLDFIQHYRPVQNVLQRPVSGSGASIALTGHHEIMVPLLAALLRLSEKSD